MDSCRLQADLADVFGACFDEPQTAREEKGSWEDIRWGQPPAANFPGQETEVQGRRGFARPVTPGPASPASPAPPAPSCTGLDLPGPACLCGSTSGRHSAWQSLGCALRTSAALTTHSPLGGTGSALQGHASPNEQIPLPHREAHQVLGEDCKLRSRRKNQAFLQGYSQD